jgi:hypothetical protein
VYHWNSANHLPVGGMDWLSGGHNQSTMPGFYDYFISKSKMTWSASPCRIIDTVCGSPLRHF